MIDIAFLRQARIGQFAIFDFVAAYLGILVISPVLTWVFSKVHLRISLISWFWLTLPMAVLFHLIFRQDTPLMKMLANPESVQFYIVVSIISVMTYLGFKKISKIA